MSVQVVDDVILLQGRCSVEDAETLLLALQDREDRIVDLVAVQRMHLAVVQILLALKPRLRGRPGDIFLSGHIFTA